MKLEEKLVSLRKAKGLSQLKLAEMMNVSRQAISRWEVGAAVPSIENLRFLSRLYGVSIDYFSKRLQEDQDMVIDRKYNCGGTDSVWSVHTFHSDFFNSIYNNRHHNDNLSAGAVDPPHCYACKNKQGLKMIYSIALMPLAAIHIAVIVLVVRAILHRKK